MTRLILNDKEVALQESFSFDYISENPDFTSSSGYSLDITLPLRGCAINEEFFGNINRLDVYTETVRYDALLISGAFRKTGAATIISITENHVKVQFLEGRSARNFEHDLNNIYINELELGYPSADASGLSTTQAWRGRIGQPDNNYPGAGIDFVALPWVNQNSGIAQNQVTPSGSGYSWTESNPLLSWFPYMIYLAKLIVKVIGYSHDFDIWEASPQKYLLCCNALPAAWWQRNFARALPHWSVNEFFTQLEYITGYTFKIENGKITCIETASDSDRTKHTHITEVVDAYTTDVDINNKSGGYIGAKNISYANRGDDDWASESCSWFVEKWNRNSILKYDTVEEINSEYGYLLEQGWMDGYDPAWLDRVFYAKDIDTYFIIKKRTITAEGENRKGYFVPLNRLGELIRDKSENADTLEIKAVPVRVCDGPGFVCIGLNVADYGEKETEEKHFESTADDVTQPLPYRIITAGESGTPEYLNKLYIGYYVSFKSDTVNRLGFRVYRDSMEFRAGSSIRYESVGDYYSLRPMDENTPIRKNHNFNIDTTKEYTIKFLYDGMPEALNIFFIKGVPYLCKKITAKFNFDGISKLKTGVFYRIID